MSSRSASPAASRLVERASRRRTPSPSPHPYLASPPPIHRTQTAPASSSQQLPSRPSTPVKSTPRRSTSPQQSYHRVRSPSNTKSRHEDMLRTRLEGVLANSAQANRSDAMDTTASTSYGSAMAISGVMTPAGRSRGPSISSACPPVMPPRSTSNGLPHITASGDHWTWGAGQPATIMSVPTSPRTKVSRAPSLSRSPVTYQPSSSNSPTSHHPQIFSAHDAMITPPPSPPYDEELSSRSPSRQPSTGASSASGLGLGHPSLVHSRSSSTAPSNSCFDARSASLMLREQTGYVSFCEVEGLGEPMGDDGDDSADGDCARGRGRWWEVWRK